ncbi:hypothetical protein NBH19_18935 [Rhizobium sp. S95]|uniref:Uncharacterized protein n=1 Tax=Ciceribacter sichuanensis TaxID=2949647 RepID=A0AAJ1C0A7_9HYPH|nr:MULTISPECIES: hypothetical protein [unclassified Ciceribacter]MCM2398149.1 hypothetical protein [Ciceribacter sp. S95]MCO5959500.1 hypothetical protein [Ciceribacter sp. S101]
MNLMMRRYIALDRHGMGGVGKLPGKAAGLPALLFYPIEYLVFYAIGVCVLMVVLILLAARWMVRLQ